MTKQDAIELMKQGVKMKHLYFTPEEWITSDPTGTTYTFEDGVECPAEEFWHWRTDPIYETEWERYQ